MDDLTKLRICVQKIGPSEQDEHNKILHNNMSVKHTEKLKAAFWSQKLWKKGSRIRIGFTEIGQDVEYTNINIGPYTDPLQKNIKNMSPQDIVKKIVNERIKPLVNLDIEFVENLSEANVRISFDPYGGAWSLVGTDHLSEKINPTMNFGWIDVQTVIHEMGHMLGMIHEHQNPRGQTIDWNAQKVFEWAKQGQGWDEETTENNIIKKYDFDSINGSSFDPQSIMLYYFPAKLTNNNVGTQENQRLSGLDVKWIHDMYPKDSPTPEDFYKDIYKESLYSSIKKSEKMAKTGKTEQTGQTGPVNLKLIYFILFIIGLFLLIGLIKWLSRI